MDVRLPDGTVIQNVPDGISKADLTAKLASNGYDVSKLGGAPAGNNVPAPEGAVPADYSKAQDATPYKGSTLTDVLKSFGTGAAQGVAGLAGLPGSLSDALSGALDTGMNKLTGADVHTASSPASGAKLNQALSNAVGGYHEPQTTAGDYAQTIGQFAPGLAMGPEGIIPRLANTVVPAVASETLGQATKGTAAEVPARIAGGLLGPGLVSAGERAGSSLAAALTSKPPTSSEVDAIAPTVDQLHQAGGSLYDMVFKDPSKNVIISKDALKGLATKVQDVATEFGYKPQLNPKVAVILNDIATLPEDNSTLMGLEMSRRVASNVARDYGTADGTLGGKITKTITDFMDNLSPDDIVGSHGAADLSGPATLQAARSTWQTLKKSTIIQNIMDNADITAGANYTQAGTDTALRRGFATLAKNPSKMAQFTGDEQDAIKLVAQGGPLGNAMRFLGKFAARGPVSAYISTGLGHALGGPIGSAALLGVGEAAKAGAESSTAANANSLAALVRGGPDAAQKLQLARTAKLAELLKAYGSGSAGLLSQAMRQPAIQGQQ